MQETWVQSLNREDPLEKGMATHSIILAWRIHGQRNQTGYIPQGCKDLDMTEWLTLSLSFWEMHQRAHVISSLILKLQQSRKDGTSRKTETTNGRLYWIQKEPYTYVVNEFLTKKPKSKEQNKTKNKSKWRKNCLFNK